MGARSESGYGGTILQVDDEEGAHRIVALHLRSWRIVHAYTAHQAVERLERVADLVLAILDLNLPDAIPEPGYADLPWFGLPAWIRRVHPNVPIIIFSAHASGRLINAAQRLGAEYIFKENFAENWRRVAERLALVELASEWHRTAYLQTLRETHRLSRRQVEVAALALRGLGPTDIAETLGISRNSAKRHSENLRRKTGHASLRALARDAVGRSGGRG